MYFDLCTKKRSFIPHFYLDKRRFSHHKMYEHIVNNSMVEHKKVRERKRKRKTSMKIGQLQLSSWSKMYASTDDCIQWFNAVISWYYCEIIVTSAIVCVLEFLCSTVCSSFFRFLFIFFHFYLWLLLWSFLLFHIIALLFPFAHRVFFTRYF